MRRARFFVVVLALRVSLGQIGLNGTFVGPQLDYWSAHANLVGDTNYCVQTAATYADGTSAGTSTINRGDGNGTVTLSGKTVCTQNDGGDTVTSGNIQLYHLTLDMTNVANITTPTFNLMASFGVNSGAIDTPSGWAGQCTSGHGTFCNWKSAKPISVNGWLVLPVYRQDVGAFYNGSDSTLIASPDGGLHWCNPYTFANRAVSPGCDSSNWSAAGDAPTNPSTSQYTDATHSAIMWKDVAPFNGSSNRMGILAFFDYCQDNSCTGMPDNADNYLYAFGANGLHSLNILARVPKDIVKIMDPAQWSYYNHAGYAPSNVGDGTDWTATLSSAVDVFGGVGTTQAHVGLNNGIVVNLGEFINPIYVCANGGCAYVAANTTFHATPTATNGNQLVPMAFPHPWGPYRITPGLMDNEVNGFWHFLRWTAWTPDSTPYHSCLATNWDNYTAGAPGGATMFFQSYCLTLASPQTGMQLLGNTPLRFSMGIQPNALIRNGLQRYFDFSEAKVIQDYGAANVPLPDLYSLDLTHYPPTAQLYGCYTEGTVKCGYPAASKGLDWDAYGITMGDAGYSARLELRDLVSSTGYGALNDTTFTANGGDTSFTISTVFRTTDNTISQTLLNAGPTGNQMYVLNYGPFPGLVIVGWHIGSTYLSATSSAGDIANNTWYNLVVTYTAGGSFDTSRVKIYINGVSHPIGAGTDPTTPSIGSGSITVGFQAANSWTLTGTMAGIGWYNRVLSPAEVAHNYAVLKAALRRRAIVLP
jgi:hypothetical protein